MSLADRLIPAALSVLIFLGLVAGVYEIGWESGHADCVHAQVKLES